MNTKVSDNDLANSILQPSSGEDVPKSKTKPEEAEKAEPVDTPKRAKKPVASTQSDVVENDDVSEDDETPELPIEGMFEDDTDVDDDPQLGEDTDETDEGDDQTDVEDDDVVELDDNYLLQIKVDGELQDVTLGELKAKYSVEGATQKRLKEATETRKLASQDRAYVAEEAEKLQASFYTVMKQFDEHLFTPTAEKPSDELKRTNPQAYINQLDAFQQESAAIDGARQALAQTFQQFQGQIEEYRKTRQRQEAEALKQVVPEVRKPDTRKAFFQEVMSAAERYGFSQDEVSNLADHRYFLMARDAAKFHALNSDTTVSSTKQAAKSKPRTLRGNNTTVQNRAKQQENAHRKAVDKARKTGKPEDLAAAIIVPNKGSRR